MTELREPPYPADTRAKGWRFELDYEQIDQSDTWPIAGEIAMAQHALLMMWLIAWAKQTPCGSFPNDENIIRAACRIPAPVWAKCRSVLMRGWWPASDGRLYHDTLVKRVLEMIERRGGDASRKKLFDEKFYAIRARDGHACVYCSARKYLSLDHLIARSRGGSGEDSNLVTACRSCNSRKGARTPDEAGMTFVNETAHGLWLSIRETLKNVLVTRYEDVTQNDKDTYHLPPNTEEKKEKAPRTRVAAPEVSKPDDVSEQVWLDWVRLRKGKRAAVTATVVAEARREAEKAGVSLERFLTIWCARGSQGLEAEWLKPHERSALGMVETTYQRSMRERAERDTPAIAARIPGAPARQNPMEVLDGLTRITG